MAQGQYPAAMERDVSIPFIAYLCGALLGTALVVRSGASSSCAGDACAGGGGDPGVVRLAIYSLLVIAGAGLGLFTDRGGMWLLLVCFASLVLLDGEGRRAWFRRVRREPVKLTWWEFLLCLFPMAPLFIFIGVVIFNDGRVPDFSPDAKAIFARVDAALRLGFEVLRGWFVVTVAGMLMNVWRRKIAALTLAR